MGMCKPSGGVAIINGARKEDTVKTITGKYGRSIPKPYGQPNSRIDMYDEATGELLQQRWFGPDGWALRDRDWNHNDSNNTHEFPHDQRWDYSKNPPRDKKWEKPDYLNYC